MADERGSEGEAARGFDRRRVLGGMVGALGAAGALGAGAPAWAQAEDEALAILLGDLEPGELEAGAARFMGFTSIDDRVLEPRRVLEAVAGEIIRESVAAAGAALWPEDPLSPDYRHLNTRTSLDPFAIDDVTLARVCAQNGFAPKGDLVLFGLRGARVLEPEGGRAFARELTPSHKDYACVLGVWNRRTRGVTAVQGSTLPSALHTAVQQRAKRAGRIAHLLPTGLHAVVVGPHRPGTAAAQAGALTLASPTSVLRSYGRSDLGAAYTIEETWELDTAGVPQSSVHAGRLDRAPYRGVAFFSSSGGPTVPGDGAAPGRAASGAWADLAAALGVGAPARVPDTLATPADGARFEFLLLTGRDVRLAGGADEPRRARLRIGSSGPKVAELQRALRVSADGVFGLATQVALLTWQLELEGLADGVVTPRLALDGFGIRL